MAIHCRAAKNSLRSTMCYIRGPGDTDSRKKLSKISCQTLFKETVSRNFLLLVFFMKQFHPSPRVSH